jgi:secreted PhoX family phosphatase
MDRRSFLRNAALTAAAAIPFQALNARVAEGSSAYRRRRDAGYGELFATLDATTGLPLIALPKGFEYVTFGWRGEPLADGTPTPGVHDGMAAYPARRGMVTLVRNHEQGGGTAFAPGPAVYNPAAAGGTTTLVFNPRRGEVVSATASLSGTIRNCAGGATPWGSWLTCEETMETRTLPHGYVFDVPADGLGDPRPIRDMGRFSHEALAVDEATGNVYLTEDAGSSSGLYRFVPHVPGKPEHGGNLSMLKVKGVELANLGAGYANGTSFEVEWVPIAQPDNPAAGTPGNFVWLQGRALGAATFARLEGCWYTDDSGARKWDDCWDDRRGWRGRDWDDDRGEYRRRRKNGRIYIVSTSGGAVSQGQVWEYAPREERLTLIFESPSSAVLNAPDNITVSPRGGLVLCEDGGGEEFLHGLTVDGEIFPFAKNTVVLPAPVHGTPAGDHSGSEWAGACYSPDGEWLFANIQGPGITLAITGPWKRGAL